MHPEQPTPEHAQPQQPPAPQPAPPTEPTERAAPTNAGPAPWGMPPAQGAAPVAPGTVPPGVLPGSVPPGYSGPPRWVLQPPPGRPPTPPDPRRRRRWLILGLVIGLVLLLCAGGVATAAVAVTRHARAMQASSPGGVTRTAADGVAKLPAVHAALDFVDADGRTMHADVTVTGDGEAAGTVTDPVAGKADLLVHGGTTIVRGDRDWWARRAPASVTALADHWVRPKTGVAFPFDLAGALRPAALAELTRKLSGAAASDTVTDTVGGVRVRTVVSGQWTALVSADKAHRLIWLGGPVRAGALARPSGASSVPGRLLPAYLADPVPLPVAQPPYVSITPTPGQPQGVQAAIANVLPQASPPAGALPSAGALPTAAATSAAQLPAQADATPKFPEFEVALNATDCFGAVCSWTVTVTNSGEAPGDVTVYATAAPGMALRTVPLGTLAPGASASTPPMAFANPAPRPRPGQTTRVTISYQAWTYSTALLGPDPKRAQDLRGRGIDPDNDLPQVDPGYMPTVLGAVDQMTRHAPGGEANQQALDGIQAAVDAGMLPDVKALVDSGRLENPQDLADKLLQARSTTPLTGPDGTIGYRREIEQAATILQRDPTAKVILDGYLPNAQTGGKDGADLLDTANRRAYQVKAVTSDKVRNAVNEAVDQLNGAKGIDGRTGVRQLAPPGYAKVALVFVEPTSPLRDKTRAEWEDYLRRAQNLKLCDTAGQPTIDRLMLVTPVGTFDWPSDQFATIGRGCR